MTDEAAGPGHDDPDAPIKKKVDSEWKKKVREEKATEQSQEEPARPPRGPLPEPTFLFFLSGLATQALLALGEIEHPETGAREADLEEARYLIDTLEMLEKKTEGNRNDEESRYLTEVLHELRMRFVQASGT
jgi:hypothetical protein